MSKHKMFVWAIEGIAVWVAIVALGSFVYFSRPVVTPTEHFVNPVGMVEVVSKEDTDNILGHGSGVFIDPTHFLTAKHVADDVVKLKFKAEPDDVPGQQTNPNPLGGFFGRIRMANGDTYNIVDVKNNDKYDVSILTVDHPYTGYIPPVSCADVATDTNLINVGNPLDMEFTTVHLSVIGGQFTKKIVQDWKEANQDQSSTTLDGLVMMTGVILPGQSGSPVFNDKGEVVGTVLMTIQDSNHNDAYTGIGLYLSNHQVCDFIGGDNTHRTFVDEIRDVFSHI